MRVSSRSGLIVHLLIAILQSLGQEVSPVSSILLSWCIANSRIWVCFVVLVLDFCFSSPLLRPTGRLDTVLYISLPPLIFIHRFHSIKTAKLPPIRCFLTVQWYSPNTSFLFRATVNVTLCCHVSLLDSGYHKGRGCHICAWCIVSGPQMKDWPEGTNEWMAGHWGKLPGTNANTEYKEWVPDTKSLSSADEANKVNF